MKALNLALAFVSFTALVAACDKDSERPPEFDLGTSLDDDLGIKNKTHVFAPNDTIYASIDTKGRSAGTVVSAMFNAPNGDVVHQGSIVIAPAAKRHTEFHVRKADGLAPGEYTVDILIGGEPVRSETFTVR